MKSHAGYVAHARKSHQQERVGSQIPAGRGAKPPGKEKKRKEKNRSGAASAYVGVATGKAGNPGRIAARAPRIRARIGLACGPGVGWVYSIRAPRSPLEISQDFPSHALIPAAALLVTAAESPPPLPFHTTPVYIRAPRLRLSSQPPGLVLLLLLVVVRSFTRRRAPSSDPPLALQSESHRVASQSRKVVASRRVRLEI